jgi:hypothetical protein
MQHCTQCLYNKICENSKKANNSCDGFKSKSEYDFEIIKKFSEKLKEKHGDKFPFSRSVFIEDIDGTIKELYENNTTS